MSFQNCKIKGVEVNSAEYHAQKGERGKLGFVMSPSSLKTGSECWQRWVDGYNPPESKAKDFGNLVDCLFLVPKQFDSRYRIRPETFPDAKGVPSASGNTKACRDWVAACEEDGVKVVTNNEVEMAQRAVRRLMADETIAAVHAACEKQVHIVGEWLDERTKTVIPVECLVDLFPRQDSEFFKSVFDLKSASSGNTRKFSKMAANLGYHIQAAFDLGMINNAEGRDQHDERITWGLIGIESFPPFQTFLRTYDATMEGSPDDPTGQGLISFGRQFFKRELAIYARCLKTGKWFDYDSDPKNDPDINTTQGWTIMRAENWMSYESMSLKLQDDTEDELQEESDDVPTP